MYPLGRPYIQRLQRQKLSWWRHQMETFSALLAICTGNSPVPRWIPHTKASDAELWCFLWSASEKNSLVNNREAGDLRRHRTYYDVTVMIATSSLSSLAVSTQPEKNGRYFTNHILYVFWDDNGCVFIEKSPECFPLTRIALVHVMACRRTDHCWVNDV